MRVFFVQFLIVLASFDIAVAKLCSSGDGYNNDTEGFAYNISWAAAGDCCSSTAGVALVEEAYFYNTGSGWQVIYSSHYISINDAQILSGCPYILV